MANADVEGGLLLGLVVARERMAGVRGLELGRGQIPVDLNDLLFLHHFHVNISRLSYLVVPSAAVYQAL